MKPAEDSNEKNRDMSLDFIRRIIAQDVENNKNMGLVITRFPPEPNGYLHIGHAKSVCLNFSIAKENKNGVCHLRFDDTNPEKESVEFEEAIKEDIKWLGYDWGDKLYYASDYYQKLYQFAIELIKMKKAYVCDLNADEVREYRGTLTAPGKDSPYRNRSISENLELFEKMKNGEFEEGSCTLRAKIDMSSPNMNMRDPAIYRIKKMSHYRTGDQWCIYPMYDFTHCLSDMLEKITHSICTLEFENNRPLYDWFLDELKTPCHPQQIEFARLNLDYTVMSKRLLLQLVNEKHVGGWDDPRMPTLSGMRRRGYPPSSIRNFCDRIGITKKDTIIDIATLENCVREELDKTAQRRMAVLDPLKVTIENYPADKIEEIDVPNHPKDESMGRRRIHFSREIYIEKSDFMTDPPKKFFRLSPGKEVRLRYAYCITCKEVIKDRDGNISELICTYDPDSLGGKTSDGRKVKGIIHWVNTKNSIDAEARLYDRLFMVPNPTGDKNVNFLEHLNPHSLIVCQNIKIGPDLLNVDSIQAYQFERQGFFSVDKKDSNNKKMIFNRTITLRDTWAKLNKN